MLVGRSIVCVWVVWIVYSVPAPIQPPTYPTYNTHINSDDADPTTDSCSAAANGGNSSHDHDDGPLLSLSRPEIVVNADGARGTPTVVARRRPEEGAEGQEEWLVGVRVCVYVYVVGRGEGLCVSIIITASTMTTQL